MMVAAASELGATNLVVYLVDFEQRLLEPIRDQSAQSALPETEEVGVSVAGRAFIERQAQVVERDDGTRVWVPIIEGSDPTGVLALTVPAVEEGDGSGLPRAGSSGRLSRSPPTPESPICTTCIAAVGR